MSKYKNDIDLAYENPNINDINNSNDIIIKDYDDEDDDDLDITNISSIVNYILNHKIQILLLILVGVIIYVVDYINQINSIIFNVSNFIPGMGYIPNNSNSTDSNANMNTIKNSRTKKIKNKK
jgi:hypothetical protein